MVKSMSIPHDMPPVAGPEIAAALHALETGDAGLRAGAAESLGQTQEEGHEALLRHMTRDRSTMVRCEACLALADGCEPQSFDTLLLVWARDKSPIVRGYAVQALVRMAEDGFSARRSLLLGHMEQRCDSEPSAWVQAILVEGLVRLGQHAYVPRLLAQLTHAEYRVRLLTASALGRLMADGMVPEARAALTDALSVERNAAVRAKLEEQLARVPLH